MSFNHDVKCSDKAHTVHSEKKNIKLVDKFNYSRISDLEDISLSDYGQLSSPSESTHLVLYLDLQDGARHSQHIVDDDEYVPHVHKLHLVRHCQLSLINYLEEFNCILKHNKLTM